MWLLDANLDIRVKAILADFGIESQTAEERGWKTLSNGDLVSAAVAQGFTCLLTRDRQFAEAAAGSLRGSPGLAVVVVRIPQAKWPEYGAAFRAAWVHQPVTPRSGQVLLWPE